MQVEPDPVAAVLWDMDGTLVDSEKVWSISLADTARHLGGEFSVAARAATFGSNLPRTLGILFDDLGLARDAEPMARAGRWLVARTGELFAGGLEWRPGALDALRTVRSAGWPTALVTNTGRALTEMALDTIGREHFTVTVCGDEVPLGKPDPDPYLRAAALLGVRAQDCLAVEDSPTGALAARRAGAAVLVVPCAVPFPPDRGPPVCAEDRPGPGWLYRESLLGLTAGDVRAAFAAIRAGRAA